MPTKREREYYTQGYRDGFQEGQRSGFNPYDPVRLGGREAQIPDISGIVSPRKPKRKLSAWNKFVKANSKKPRFRYARSNKINLKKMAVAFRKTPAGRKKRR